MAKEINATNLKYSKLQIGEVESIVKSWLATIDDSIEEAHEKGQVSVEVSLPIAFDIPNLERSAARRRVYALIVEDLTSIQRGFVVRLFMKKDESKIYVTWLTEEDELLRKHEKDIIEYYTLPWEDRKNKDRPNSLPFNERISHYKNPIDSRF